MYFWATEKEAAPKKINNEENLPRIGTEGIEERERTTQTDTNKQTNKWANLVLPGRFVCTTPPSKGTLPFFFFFFLRVVDT